MGAKSSLLVIPERVQPTEGKCECCECSEEVATQTEIVMDLDMPIGWHSLEIPRILLGFLSASDVPSLRVIQEGYI
jgi:hypothetical protein